MHHPLRHLSAVAEDRDLSPATGWVREHWTAAADDLLLAVRPYATPGFGRLDLPGEPARAGWVSDGLEGFARTFLTAAFRTAHGDDPHDHLDRYRSGLLAGTRTPGADDAESWPVVRSVRVAGQPMVESASVALALDLTRERLWDTLSGDEQDRVEAWLRGSLRHEPAPNNWYLFPLTVASFLTGVGRGDAETERAVERGSALLDGWYVGDGWYSDGDGRMFDHYVGWAMHLYPCFHALLRDGGTGPRAELLGGRLREFLATFARTFDGDGAPLHQGRSLTYRWAAVSSVALGAVTGWSPLPPGTSRHLLSAGLRHFLDRDDVLHRGVLTRGWYGPHAASLQPYSGPSSPYWASKGFAALLAGPEHELWTAVEEPLPSQGAARTTPVRPAGWLVQSTPDGLVRVHNHGSDHRSPDHPGGHPVDPLYHRLAYSTRTGPTSARNVPDNAVVLHVDGQDSRRSTFTPCGGGDDWVAGRHHPLFEGTALPQARVTSTVLARGAWEVRVHAFTAVPPGTPVTVTGWALAVDDPADLTSAVEGGAVDLRTPTLRSQLAGDGALDVVRAPAGTAFGAWGAVPRLRTTADAPVVCVVSLSAEEPGPAPAVRSDGADVVVTWGDGTVVHVDPAAPAVHTPS